MLNLKLIFLSLCFLACNFACGQQNDSTAIQVSSSSTSKEVKKSIYGSARKASILSACLPGLGQAYNKKYWKIPIIYAVLGGLTYWGVSNHNDYKFYSNNLKAIYDDDPSTNNTSGYSSDNLVYLKRTSKKYRDMAILLGALVYGLNIIDANVDAHLKTFDISDDLSMKIKPYGNLDYNNNFQTGLTIKLNFK